MVDSLTAGPRLELPLVRAIRYGELRALDPGSDVTEIVTAVDAFAAGCSGADATGRLANTALGERFRWLTAPRSTVVQSGPVHAGHTEGPCGRVGAVARSAGALTPVASTVPHEDFSCFTRSAGVVEDGIPHLT